MLSVTWRGCSTLSLWRNPGATIFAWVVPEPAIHRYSGSLPRLLRIFFHDACFDGTASAALFSAFYRDVIDRSVEIDPVGMIHRDGDPFVDAAFDADDHACVDFRFSANQHMRWWFDHHATAFQPPQLREIFDGAKPAQRATWCFDAKAASCTGLLARELERGWSWRPPPYLTEVIRWADTIDAAAFASADAAVALDEPAQQVAAWLAHGRKGGETAAYIKQLSHRSISQIAQDPEMRQAIAQIADGRSDLRTALVHCAQQDGAVVVFDRLAVPGARSPGFLGYQLFPDAKYSIAATTSDQAIKISVGVNPWTTRYGGASHNIGELCAALGGGGHAVVGGITLRLDEQVRAKAAIAALVVALR